MFLIVRKKGRILYDSNNDTFYFYFLSFYPYMLGVIFIVMTIMLIIDLILAIVGYIKDAYNAIFHSNGKLCSDYETGGLTMKMSNLTFEQIQIYDPLHSKSNRLGIRKEWVARNQWGNAVAFGDTKAECIKDARRYCQKEH